MFQICIVILIVYYDPMKKLPPDALYRLNGKQYRLAMQKDDVVFLTGVGNDESIIAYAWHATVNSISHMIQVAIWQGYLEHVDSGEVELAGEDCNYMVLSPTITPVKPLRIDQPSVDPDEWEEEEEDYGKPTT